MNAIEQTRDFHTLKVPFSVLILSTTHFEWIFNTLAELDMKQQECTIFYSILQLLTECHGNKTILNFFFFLI